MKKVWLLFFGVVLGVGLMGGGTLAAAQTAGDEFQLEEITVTAQKRAENQQKVPITMEVVSAEELKQSGKNNLDAILSEVSSVLINKASDGLRITLRGVSDDGSPFQGQSVSMPTVAVNMDGVYSNRKDSGSGLFDLERVEVLYGPQSTMYSSNSPGGIVNVVTANPKLDTYEVRGTLEVGNYDLLHTEGSMNVPMSDTLALRAAFTTSVRDGYLSNGGNSEDTKSARLRLLYQPIEALSFVVTGELSKSSGYGFASVDAFVNQDDVDDPWHTDDILGEPSTNKSERLYGRVDWDLGFASMSLVPAYTTQTGHMQQVRVFFGETTIQESDTHGEEKSVELRMTSSPDFFFTWIVGVNYYKSKDVRYNASYDESGTFTGTYRNVDSNEEAKAVFANITYPLTDSFRATAGYRKSWDDVILYNAEARGILGGPNAGQLEEVFEVHEDSYSDPDYKIGVEYDLNANSMLYADFSTSYRVQAMGGGAPGTGSEEKPPEKLLAYSAGAKNRFFDNKLQVNAAAFYYDYENYSAGNRVTAFTGDPENPDHYNSTYTTGDPNSSKWGDGRMMGVDLQTTAIITSKDILNLSISYLKSEWTNLVFDYYYDYKVIATGPPGAPFTRDDIVPAETDNYNGKPMTKAPEWTINATFSHRFNLWNGGNLEAKINTNYKTEYHLSWKEVDYPLNYQEPFFITNLTATYNNPDGKWSLSAYVRNVGNYAEKRGYFGNPINDTMVGNPRTYAAVLSASF